MSHWFDDLTLKLTADGAVSRRKAVGNVMAGLLAPGLVRRLAGTSGDAAGQPRGHATPAMDSVLAADACIRQTTTAGGSVSEVTVADGQLTFEHRFAVLPDGSTTSGILVKNGNAIVWKFNSTGAKGHTGSATATYGPAITGARTQTLQTEDGKAFRGAVDGRAFTMDANVHSIGAAKFADGHAAATIQVDSSLNSRIASLGARSMSALATCTNPTKIAPHLAFQLNAKTAVRAPTAKLALASSTAKKVSPVPSQRAATAVGGGHFVQPVRPIGNAGPIGAVNGTARGDGSDAGWNSPGQTYPAGGTANSPACDQCYTDATNTARHDTGLDSVEGWLAAISDAGASIIAFNIEAAALMAACNIPGQACYPVLCGGPFEACASGDQCVQSGICCATSSNSQSAGAVCNGVCCGHGITSCAPDGYCACPSGLAICGDQCCPSGSNCCNGQCYTSGTECCGDVPCLGGTKCLKGKNGDICCFNGSLCLDTYCCGLNTCTKDGCCQQEQVCGDACCPTGEVCQNGACFKPPCAANVAWCNGQCCPAASDAHGAIVCCTPHTMDVAPFNNMNPGCHHSSACYTVPR